MSGSLILCIPDVTTLVDPNPDCPRAELHTPCPPGYLAWFDWAGSRVGKGSRQSRCPGCGLYNVWSPLPPRAASPTERTPDQ